MLKYQLEKEKADPSQARNIQDTLTRNAHSADFVQYIHQRISSHITQDDDYRRPFVFLYGIGSMYPYLRVNEFLALYEDYNDTSKYKIIVFYPHNLKTRRIGANIAVEVHVRVSGDMTVAKSHASTVKIEQKLKEKYGAGTQVIIHIEPVK